MKNRHRHMALSMFMHADTNYNVSGWRDPASDGDAGINFDRWIDYVKILERARFDMLFIADFTSPTGLDDPETFGRTARNFCLEPITVLSALASATKNLGLAATISTTWTDPYNVARMLASLDRISHGRAGWNVVTGRNPEDALNFNLKTAVPLEARYARAEEFVDVCFGLWKSYDEDAFLIDKTSGIFCDPNKYRLLNHVGEHFSVRGPINVARPVQGRPLIIQSGLSSVARNLSARVADCVFGLTPTFEDAQEYYKDMKKRVAAFDRNPDQLKILPGVSIYIAPTRAEAQAKFDRLIKYTSPDYAIKQLGLLCGVDLSGYPPDGPIPPLPSNDMVSDPERKARGPRREGLSIKQFALRNAAAKSHWALVGSPKDIVDQLEHWFNSEAADGFNVLPPCTPESLIDYAELLVPELQRRGLVATSYQGSTLRENLGLDVPR